MSQHAKQTTSRDRDAQAASGRKADRWRAFLPNYLPPPRVITRAEMLATAKDAGLPLNERTLRFWETVGALPHAERQQHEGAVRAVYPYWFADVVYGVLRLRDEQGKSLAEIAALMPEMVQWCGIVSWLRANHNSTVQGAMPSLLPPLEQLASTFATPTRPISQGLVILFDNAQQVVARLWWDQPDPLVSDGEADAPPSDSNCQSVVILPSD